MTAPRFSVIVPAWDAAATLDTALRSVARQSVSDWECIVVDDGSKDGTADRAAEAAARDARFRVHRQPHRGVVAALNRALAICRGRYVARLDADDWMHRRRLALQGQLLDERSELDAVGCWVRYFPRRRLGPGMIAYEAWLNSIEDEDGVRRELFVECPVAGPAILARREPLQELGFHADRWPEDYDLILRFVTGGRRIGMVPRRLLGWRYRDESLSRTGTDFQQDRFTACKAAYLASSFLSESRDYVLWGYGGTGKSLRQALLEHGKLPSAVVEVHPGRLGNRIQGAPVVAPYQLRDLPRAPIVVSVAGAGARRVIRAALGDMGFQELRDFVCAA